MSLYKRKTSPNWQYKLYPPGGGTPVQGSTGTSNKEQAQEFHDRLKVDLWNRARLGTKPRYTWNEAVVRYVGERDGLPSLETSKTHLRWLDRHLAGVALADIDRDRIDAIALEKRREPLVIRTKRGIVTTDRTASAGTVRRVIGVLKAVLNAAVEWEWLDRAPVTKRAKVVQKRIRWLNQAEAERLLAELPGHLAEMARFSLETGLRRSNVTGLQWSQVDIARRVAWIHPDQAKAKKAITVPLSDTAIAVLSRQRAHERAPGCADHVFVYQGKPVYQTATAAWRKALERAGIRDFRWHDLRHTWASWHVQRGTPLQVLKELGGWETMEMVQRYAHLSADHLAQWVTPLTAEPAPMLAAI
ncbi:site-specific integrase [Burkholderia stagnalis]|uniref:Site-specific integrase n=1 Tax=Burkholderia stagnalis TaxID=1503054 RepID=A0ABX9YV26_9BURK|nr:site-specific integrase [Burkholderia stagnalis]RQQ70494.1 site-specific integrase [Burkholderia stagnalis]RQQ71582.1 site-specific integrase [Burkholderia stagnalis]RQQ83763.1 site-specific integrase [Burkholderia stagnalis]RQQ92116.1 site-specific integrase [Burkholderia stagnalis]